MKGRICLCPASIAWIRKHLMKSARRKFTSLLTRGTVLERTRTITRVSGKKVIRKKRLRAGIHKVRIRGNLRRVEVLRNGQWRFLKG